MKNITQFFLIGIVAAVAGFGGWMLLQKDSGSPITSSRVQDATIAPDFTLPTLNKSSVTMSEYRGENGAIIFFWATWCPHCRVQLQELNAQSEVFNEKSIRVILIDIGESAEQVKNFIEKNNIGYDVFLDQDNSVADEYGIIGVPTFYFLNPKGVIQLVAHALPENLEEVIFGNN